MSENINYVYLLVVVDSFTGLTTPQKAEMAWSVVGAGASSCFIFEPSFRLVGMHWDPGKVRI